MVFVCAMDCWYFCCDGVRVSHDGMACLSVMGGSREVCAVPHPDKGMFMSRAKTIAFIGAGNVTRAIIAGLIQNGFDPDGIWASSPTIAKRKNTIPFPIHFVANNDEAVKATDTIVFAVK